MVEQDLAKVGVAISILVSLSKIYISRSNAPEVMLWFYNKPVNSRMQQASQCGNSSVGRARPCQGRGREFESRFPLILSASLGVGCGCETHTLFVSTHSNPHSPSNPTCRDGGTGRHAGLKILWPLKPCGFDSRSWY